MYRTIFTPMNNIKLIISLILLLPFVIFGQTTTEIAKTSIKSTVSIVALDNISQPLGYGSGFIIDDELIVTNVHVIEGCNSAYVLLDGQEKRYTVSGYVAIDKSNDLIIIKVLGLYGSRLKLGSETLPEIGEKIYTVGNPKGLNGTFSEGIISGIRELTANQVLQITAPISPGSSGGPVLNTAGNVVGISFASFSEGQNLNFAIPVKYLINLKKQMGAITSLSTVKAQAKTATSKPVNPNIVEGVIVRNIEMINMGYLTETSFSIKNNLAYTVSDITILFLLYDATGTVIDYVEQTFLKNYESPHARTTGRKPELKGIKPFLAKSFNDHTADSSPTLRVAYNEKYKLKARVLDFKINEEE